MVNQLALYMNGIWSLSNCCTVQWVGCQYVDCRSQSGNALARGYPALRQRHLPRAQSHNPSEMGGTAPAAESV